MSESILQSQPLSIILRCELFIDNVIEFSMVIYWQNLLYYHLINVIILPDGNNKLI